MNNNIDNEENNVIKDEDEEMIKCPKCGTPMKKSWRCCMHCGELNFLNEDNTSMKPYVQKADKLKEKEAKKLLRKQKKNVTTLDTIESGKKVKNFTILNKVSNLFVIVVLIVMAINYKSVMNIFNEFRKDMYIKQVTKMVNKLDRDPLIAKCLTVSEDGRKYFTFYDSADYFSTFASLYTLGYFSGAIEIIDNSDGTRSYRVSITDGKFGFNNIELDKDKMKKSLKELANIDYPKGNSVCE